MNGTATTLTPTEGATSNGVEPAGGAPTNTVRLRSSLPARIVSVAVPATPVTIEMSELCDPTGTSEAVAAATAGFELVIVTVVAAAAGVERTCTRVAVLCATGVTMEPTDGGFAMLNPTIGAVSSGVDPGGGGPTKTVTLRTSLPARMINVATPAAPVMISIRRALLAGGDAAARSGGDPRIRADDRNRGRGAGRGREHLDERGGGLPGRGPDEPGRRRVRDRRADRRGQRRQLAARRTTALTDTLGGCRPVRGRSENRGCARGDAGDFGSHRQFDPPAGSPG